MNQLFQSMLDYTFRCNKCREMCSDHWLRFITIRDRHDDEAYISDAEIEAFLVSWASCLNCGVCERHAHEAQPLVVYGSPPRLVWWEEWSAHAFSGQIQHGAKLTLLYWQWPLLLSHAGIKNYDIPAHWLAL